AEPTSEPTAEPTSEPTAEPTVEVTITPTVTATVEVTPTVTVTPTVEVSAGEISSAAVPGTWSSQYIIIQNLGSSTASASLALHQNSSTASQTISKSIPGNGAVTVAGSEITNSGSFAGVISSNQPIAAGVINTNSTGKLGDAYAGFSEPSNEQTIPLIFRGHANTKTTFYIQNAEATAQTVTIKTIKQGNAVETPSGGIQVQIQGNSSVTVDFMSSSFNAFGSGNGAFGYAIIEGSGSGKVATLAENVLDVSGKYQSAFVQGLNANAGGTSLVAPLIYNSHANFNSGLNIINLTGTATTVTLNFNADAGAYPSVGSKSHSVSLAGNSVVNINMAALNKSKIIPTSFGGGTISTSPAVNIVAVVNTNKVVNGSFAFSSPAVNPGLATSNVAAPVALQLGTTGGAFNSGINIFSPNGATGVTTQWVIANTDPPETYTISQSFSNGVVNLNAATLRKNGQLPNKNFVGSVFMTFTGGSGIVVVNNDFASGGLSTQMLGVNY
ncbi:MAG: hypothetical protein HC875_22430, partial [Anaerolineales bacterium]|nr:hypothetical protein [Anaerolineales bacterium]